MTEKSKQMNGDYLNTAACESSSTFGVGVKGISKRKN
jgi:hypothetical protein